MRKIEISEKHIYCLEGNWNKNPRNSQSVKPILELLNTSVGVKYIYRKCNTKEEFIEYLRQYTFKRYQNYSILYLAFHGRANRICIRKEDITLEEVAFVLKGKLKDKFIHFGSCSTLKTSEKNISNFITDTKCSFISGYRKNVGYLYSTAFELLYFELLQKKKTYKQIEKTLKIQYAVFINKLEFISVE